MRCPFCAEAISDSAVRCKYCQKSLLPTNYGAHVPEFKPPPDLSVPPPERRSAPKPDDAAASRTPGSAGRATASSPQATTPTEPQGAAPPSSGGAARRNTTSVGTSSPRAPVSPSPHQDDPETAEVQPEALGEEPPVLLFTPLPQASARPNVRREHDDEGDSLHIPFAPPSSGLVPPAALSELAAVSDPDTLAVEDSPAAVDNRLSAPENADERTARTERDVARPEAPTKSQSAAKPPLNVVPPPKAPPPRIEGRPPAVEGGPPRRDAARPKTSSSARSNPAGEAPPDPATRELKIQRERILQEARHRNEVLSNALDSGEVPEKVLRLAYELRKFIINSNTGDDEALDAELQKVMIVIEELESAGYRITEPLLDLQPRPGTGSKTLIVCGIGAVILIALLWWGIASLIRGGNASNAKAPGRITGRVVLDVNGVPTAVANETVALARSSPATVQLYNRLSSYHNKEQAFKALRQERPTVPIVGDTLSDAVGQYAFENVRPGNYFLMVVASKYEEEAGVWMVPVDVYAGKPTAMNLLEGNQLR